MQKALRVYQTLLKQHPFWANSLTTATLVGGGDVIAQTAFESKKYDASRTARMAFFGAILGPVIARWYIFLESKIGPSTSFLNTGKKIASDQLGFAPICNAFCISSIALLEGRSPREDLRNNYKDVIIANYKLWPLVQVVNFTLVPLHLRTLVVQVVALGWNTYFMWKLHGSSTNQNNIK